MGSSWVVSRMGWGHGLCLGRGEGHRLCLGEVGSWIVSRGHGLPVKG